VRLNHKRSRSKNEKEIYFLMKAASDCESVCVCVFVPAIIELTFGEEERKNYYFVVGWKEKGAQG
jgi:hypothetical protein